MHQIFRGFFSERLCFDPKLERQVGYIVFESCITIIDLKYYSSKSL